MGALNVSQTTQKILGLFQGGNTGIFLKIGLGLLVPILILWVAAKIKEMQAKAAHAAQESKFVQDQQAAAKQNAKENAQVASSEQSTDAWAQQQREKKGP